MDGTLRSALAPVLQVTFSGLEATSSTWTCIDAPAPKKILPIFGAASSCHPTWELYSLQRRNFMLQVEIDRKKMHKIR